MHLGLLVLYLKVSRYTFNIFGSYTSCDKMTKKGIDDSFIWPLLLKYWAWQFCINGSVQRELQYFSVLGCSDFSWYIHFNYFVRLSQESLNPSVYTRLHCYLPWIAKQYFMLYTSVLDPVFDPACNNGQGDINEVGTEECRSNPTNQPANYYLVRSPEESSCIFPFQLDGQEYNKCILQAWVYIFKDSLIGGGWKVKDKS